MKPMPGTLCFATLTEVTGSALPLWNDLHGSFDYDQTLNKGTYFMIISSMKHFDETYLVITSDGNIGWTLWQSRNFKIIQ